MALTGATGFLGRRIGLAAAAAGWSVRALIRPRAGAGLRRPGFAADIVAGDLDDRAALARLCDGAAVILHNAGSVRAPSAQAFMAANRDGAIRAAEAACERAGDASAFVLVSSLAATRPGISPYAASKAAGEAGVRRVLSGRRLAILRPPAIYGPDDLATKPLFDAFRLGLAPRFGPAGARLAMLYVDDAATAALAAADLADTDGRAFEIDDGAGGYTWAEIGATAAAVLDRRLLPLPVPRPLMLAAGAFGSARARLGCGIPFLTLGKAREGLAGDWLPDPAAALPGWSADTSLRSGFTKTLTWYRDRRKSTI